MNNQESQDKTHFGFQTVDKTAKVGMVKGVFDNVASKYDIMNDAMSMGVHRLWKKQFIQTLNPASGGKLLDVAGGTGDIAFKAIKKMGSGSQVTICDINHEMLKVGKLRAIDNNILSGLDWMCGNAEHLPYADQSFDYYSIAFGIRNVTNIQQALNDAFRVLKTGGHFCCLEFSNVNNAMLKKIYDFYSFNVIPKIGQLITGDADSYQYLVESIRNFPDQETFKNMIEESGFSHVKYQNLTSGVVAIHSGWKI